MTASWLDEPPPAATLRGGPVPARVGNVLVGTASWTERTLLESGAFYPPQVRTAERRLRYYARHFPVVEVDASYYALPQPRTAAAWVERTPPGFVFGVKAFAALTGHPIERARLDRDLQVALPRLPRLYPRDVPADVLEAIWQRFRAALAPLRAAGKLAYVLLQMPPWFVPSHESDAVLDDAARRLPDVQVAVEFRAAGWLAERRRARTLAALGERGFTYVCVDEPQGTRASVPPVAAVTSPALAVVRFHGRRRETWDRRGVSTTERFDYLYSAAELAEWVAPIRRLAAETRTVCVLMNNCRRESAVRNAKELAELLAKAGGV
ncbi:MAG TPA: DUF72 domain-containing protein [Candidatus Binatia bacterium]|nr:DUF72 domain-containing protein [Candidatus Binatia bacterium]